MSASPELKQIKIYGKTYSKCVHQHIENIFGILCFFLPFREQHHSRGKCCHCPNYHAYRLHTTDDNTIRFIQSPACCQTEQKHRNHYNRNDLCKLPGGNQGSTAVGAVFFISRRISLMTSRITETTANIAYITIEAILIGILGSSV